MMIVVAFCCSIGGWFVGCVSAYLLYRWVERRTPPNVDERRESLDQDSGANMRPFYRESSPIQLGPPSPFFFIAPNRCQSRRRLQIRAMVKRSVSQDSQSQAMPYQYSGRRRR